jgi:hypothetical protein
VQQLALAWLRLSTLNDCQQTWSQAYTSMIVNDKLIKWINMYPKLKIGWFCLFVYSRLSNFQLSGGCHHYRWQGCKFRPMLALMAFSSEDSFSCHTYCDTGPRFIWSHPMDRHPRPTVGFEWRDQFQNEIINFTIKPFYTIFI